MTKDAKSIHITDPKTRKFAGRVSLVGKKNPQAGLAFSPRKSYWEEDTQNFGSVGAYAYKDIHSRLDSLPSSESLSTTRLPKIKRNYIGEVVEAYNQRCQISLRSISSVEFRDINKLYNALESEIGAEKVRSLR